MLPMKKFGITSAKSKNSHRSAPCPSTLSERLNWWRERGGDVGDRLTDIHTGTERETDRQIDRQTETERDRARNGRDDCSEA